MDSQRRSKPVRDNIYWGAFLGIIFPALGFLLFYVYYFTDTYSLNEYWDSLFNNSKMSAAISLALLLNLPVFFFNLWNGKNETVKGILGATIFYGLFVIFFKFT